MNIFDFLDRAFEAKKITVYFIDVDEIPHKYIETYDIAGVDVTNGKILYKVTNIFGEERTAKASYENFYKVEFDGKVYDNGGRELTTGYCFDDDFPRVEYDYKLRKQKKLEQVN